MHTRERPMSLHILCISDTCVSPSEPQGVAGVLGVLFAGQSQSSMRLAGINEFSRAVLRSGRTAENMTLFFAQEVSRGCFETPWS